MAASTTLSYHVNGPLIPQCNIGSANAYVSIGECRDGASIVITPIKHGIKSDAGGGVEGGDVNKLMLNAIAEIRFTLVPYAGTYTNKLRAMAIGSATEGTLVVPGFDMGAASMFPGLYLPNGGGTDVDGPWNFPVCEIVAPGNVQEWTKESAPEFVFRAFIYIDPSAELSVASGVLYTRAAPA